MKYILMKYLLPFIIDELIKAMKKLAQKSDNTIDDRLVESIESNKEAIIKEIKE